ncbi:hypothetical protein HDU82_001733 [Entophlyctis luteolus]|nr:hypothetical protein HDU82_001733 [Entophlyctis luteolus]
MVILFLVYVNTYTFWQFLESLKADRSAADIGLHLAQSPDASHAVAFFGLALIAHVLRFAYDMLSPTEKESLKAGLTMLMQEYALIIFKTLSEDVFVFENTIGEMRKKDLSTALMAITLDVDILNSVYFADRQYKSAASKHYAVQEFAADDVLNFIRADRMRTGWLSRLIENLVALKTSKYGQLDHEFQEKLTISTLESIGVIMHWMILDGIESTGVLRVLLELLTSHSVQERLGTSPYTSPLTSAYDEIEFEGEGERKSCIESNKHRYSEIFAMVTIEMDCESMDDIIYLSHSSFEAKKVEIAIRLENVVEVIEICLKSIIQKGKWCILGICTCFASTLDDDDLLLKFVEKLFALVTFVLPGEEVARGNLGEDTRNLRMKAASILVKLAGALPNRLTPHFNQLVAVIQSRIKIGIVLQFERAKLIEFIIALVHGCDGPDPDEKLRMFSMIISSEVAEWEAAFSSGGAFSCAFNNGEELLQTLGVSTQSK